MAFRRVSSFLLFLSLLSFGFSLPIHAASEEPEAEVTIWCSHRINDASQLQSFLGAGGGLYYHSSDYNDTLVQAWRRLGFKHITFETLHSEDPVDRWITVTRDKDGMIAVDFTEYDKYMESYLHHLEAVPFVYLGGVPRLLSSKPEDENYSAYMPKDLEEWSRFVSIIVRHNIEKWGLRGIDYGPPGEPDHLDSWRGRGGTDRKEILRDHIELYAATYRAVKAADPKARIGGPSSMSWQITEYTDNDQTGFVLADWIKELAYYNSQYVSQSVGLDYISWQDYGWAGENLSEGAHAVSQMLSANGFDPNTPKFLAGSGWGSWGSNYLNTELTPYQRASFVLHNLLREFKDPEKKSFEKALYFTFFYKDEWRLPQNPTDDPYTPEVSLVRVSSDGKLSYSPTYAAFEMVNHMAVGDILQTVASGDIEAMASRNDKDQSLTVTVNNHTANEIHTQISLKEMPFPAQRVRAGVRRIDALNSSDGAGLQEPKWEEIESEGDSLKKILILGPFTSAQLIFYPIPDPVLPAPAEPAAVNPA